MSTASYLTAQHAKLDAHISVLREPLYSESNPLLSDPESLHEIRAYSERIGEMLEDYIHDQKHALLLQATRILGDSLEEVCAIHEENAKLVAQYKRFNELLSDVDFTLDEEWLAELQAQFKELYACFERQSDAERVFYSLYSTIIFPAGAATD